jgi:NADH-quinone oxidoreductase subunit G
LLDNGRLQDGEPYLAGTAPRPVARLSPATAAEIGVAEGGDVAVSTHAGRITLPVVLDDLPDRVVWIPTDSQSSTVHASLRATAGAVVNIVRVSDVATSGSAGSTGAATATATGGGA